MKDLIVCIRWDKEDEADVDIEAEDVIKDDGGASDVGEIDDADVVVIQVSPAGQASEEQGWNAPGRYVGRGK